MDLLPRTHDEFRSREYWDNFFIQRKEKAFEWYGDYEELKPYLCQSIKKNHRILTLGCGNSDLSANMYDDGFHQIVNIDFSSIVIDEMNKKNASRPEMQYVEMNMLDLKYEENTFESVLDKGALDALFANDTEATRADVTQMFTEIARVLKPNGTYFCVSLLQDHILRHALNFFALRSDFTVSIAQVKLLSSTSKLVPFIFLATKCPSPVPLSIECQLSSGTHSATTIEEVLSVVSDAQQSTTRRAQLKQIRAGQRVQLDLWMGDAAVSTPRFTVTVIDNKQKGTSGEVGVFLIPQGREHEWMFYTEEGQFQLVEGAGFKRLIIVSLNRGHTFQSMEAVQQELNPRIFELVPEPRETDEKIPYLTVGNSIGERQVQLEIDSAMSGKMVVEDVTEEEKTFRRLIFMSNQNMIQSEVRLLSADESAAKAEKEKKQKVKANKSKGKAGKKKRQQHKSTTSTTQQEEAEDDIQEDHVSTIDWSYLSFDLHKAFVAALAAIPKIFSTQQSVHVVMIGCGGGVLPMFLHQFFPSLHIHIVELDPVVVQVAKEQFGLVENERITIHIADGLLYLRDLAIKTVQDPSIKPHVIYFDVNSNDATVAMTCPPEPFVTVEMLTTVRDVLCPGGMLVLNLACRSAFVYGDVISRLRSVFTGLYESKMDVDTNRIIAAVTDTKVRTNGELLNGAFVLGQQQSSRWDSSFDLGEWATRFKQMLSADEEAALQAKNKKNKKKK